MKQNEQSTKSMWSQAIRDVLPYTNLGWQLVATMLLFFGAGYLLDSWLDSGDTMKILLSVPGIIFALYYFIRSIQQLQDKRKTHTP